MKKKAVDFKKKEDEERAELEACFSEDAEKNSSKKGWIVFLVFGILCFGGGIFSLIYAFTRPTETLDEPKYPEIPSKTQVSAKYSLLTGEEVDESYQLDGPTYCVQTPNGLDGARPQAGLNEAGVIFEAIAETGITRFAAIYQNPTSSVIGPIRSLRLYYLEWDTPFNCTIVHAGGADDALAAVRRGGYRDMTENYTYMYRGTNGERRWNNLFTTASNLRSYSENNGYTSSKISGFSRLSPEEAKKQRVDELMETKLDILAPTNQNTSELTAKVETALLRFGSVNSFNVRYTYDAATNTYLRSYENGVAHNIYKCPSEDLGNRDPENTCELEQLAPSVVIAMIVNERRASDGYHEDITTVGSGDAYIFQNGTVTKGVWHKYTVAEQIKFVDEKGEEIKLVPGQTIVSAIPTYGSVEF